jgi:hypothetical protein
MRKIKLQTKKRWAVHTNTSLEDKVAIRRHVMEKLGKDNPRILDCFCANGLMWRHAYDCSKNYIGLDLNDPNDERHTVVCDNRRYLRHADLDQFDIFDLDAFGSPLEQLAIICNRIPWTTKTKVGVVLTDGTGLNAKLNSVNAGMLKWLGLSRHRGAKVQMEDRDNIIAMGILKAAEMARATVSDVEVYKKETGSGMRYIGFILHKK